MEGPIDVKAYFKRLSSRIDQIIKNIPTITRQDLLPQGTI
jgi:hypothetical protein